MILNTDLTTRSEQLLNDCCLCWEKDGQQQAQELMHTSSSLVATWLHGSDASMMLHHPFIITTIEIPIILDFKTHSEDGKTLPKFNLKHIRRNVKINNLNCDKTSFGFKVNAMEY